MTRSYGTPHSALSSPGRIQRSMISSPVTTLSRKIGSSSQSSSNSLPRVPVAFDAKFYRIAQRSFIVISILTTLHGGSLKPTGHRSESSWETELPEKLTIPPPLPTGRAGVRSRVAKK
uniref:Uncharacterized protein n=1 Tax=Photinus pyralis TaxID=7054 RepID=A0A1Y1LYW9_PHOPY